MIEMQAIPRATRRCGEHDDCRPLTVPQLETLLPDAGFGYAQQHGRAQRLTYERERPDALAWRALFRWLPEWLWKLARRAFPTLIYMVRPAESPV